MPLLSTTQFTNLLLGLAIGDAYGAGVEFQDRDWIRANVDFTKFVNARSRIPVPEEQLERFTKNYCAWDYTDDTEMTVGLINALVSDEKFDEDLLVREWKAEYDRGAKTKGFGRNGHGSMAWYYSGELTIEAVRDFQRERPNPGNAPAMRAVPLGLLPEVLINEYATINANATHPNVAAVLSSRCIARAAHFLIIRDGDPNHLIDYCLATIEPDSTYRDYLMAVDQLPDFPSLSDNDFAILCGPQPIVPPYFLPGIKGLPSDSMYTAGSVLYILKHNATAFEALRQSILLGGDVDSVASITVGIVASKSGLDSLPSFMLEEVEGIEYLREVALRFADWLTA